MIGNTLSHYKIIEKLGQGGMGEVYLAEDSRLDRKVALKILPQHLSEKAELRERFEREARAVSSLNHPHICTLYDIGEQDGIHYLVMEHLVGETLEARLAKGALPLEQTLEYAIQIADALDKAHRQGVVHRDLKPGNIMLVKSGAKLLDFGLAKLQRADTPTNLSALPTEQANLTAEGTILGTLQYMAPEQLEGKEADGRTDIFAFGATVYEMATGKKAFEGKSQASLIAAIMGQEPRPMEELQPMTPQLLDWVVKRCLSKEPDERWQAASDVMAGLRQTTEVGTQVALPGSVTAPVLWKKAMPWSLAFLVLGAVLSGIGVWLLKPAPALLPQTPLHVVIPLAGEQLADHGGPPIAISPDGMQLVYVVRGGGTSQLYLRPLSSSASKAIPGTEEAMTPFFSPDSQWIGFAAQGNLKKIALSGGAPINLCESSNLVGASWGEDGTIVFVPSTTSPLLRVSADGGTPEVLTTLDRAQGETSHRYPQFLPGGETLLFTAMSSGGWDEQDVVAFRLASGERHTVVRGGHTGRLLPSGHLVYGRAGSLLALPFDFSRLEVTSTTPVTILEGVKTASNLSADFTYSLGGSMAYVPARPNEFESRLVWVDRNGVTQPIPAPVRNYLELRLSPDGRQVVVRITGNSSENWIYNLERGTLSRLTAEGSNLNPLWTPDGKRIAYRSSRAGYRNIYWRAADGTDTEEQLTTGDNQQAPQSWSPDGKILAFSDNSPTTSTDIWILPMDEQRNAEPFLQTAFSEGAATFSPDGGWLAYNSDESGRNEIYVLPFPGPGRKWQVSTDGGTVPRWNPQGGELFYKTPDNKMMAVNVTTSPTFSAGRPRVLFEGLERFHGYCCEVAPDGQHFLAIEPVEPEVPSAQINVILNWFEELKRVVPTDN